jgi:hypothetical protein
MIEFRVFKSGGSWIAKRTGSNWTSGFQRSEQDAIESATREARFMRDAKVIAVRNSGEEELYSSDKRKSQRGIHMTLSLG